jgi:hypothetical protein
VIGACFIRGSFFFHTCVYTLSHWLSQVLNFVGYVELRSIGGVLLPFKTAWPGVDQTYSFIIDPGVDTPGFIFSISLFPRRLVLVLSALCGLMCASGPQSQPIKFQFLKVKSLHSTLGHHIAISLFCFTTLVLLVGFRIHPKLSTKIAAISFPRTRVYLAPPFPLVSIGSLMFMNDTLHAFASRNSKSPTFGLRTN